MKPNCYECIHRRNVPGDAHSQCVHPLVSPKGEVDAISALFTIFNGEAMSAAKELKITANPHGIKCGWFMWPANFDPVWLESCEGFESKIKKEETKHE